MVDTGSLDSQQLKDYLTIVAGSPGGRSKVVGLAARAALRAIPQLDLIGSEAEAKKEDYLLATFRSASAAWAASVYPEAALKIGSSVFNAPSAARELLKNTEPSSASVIRSINLVADAASAARTQNDPSGYAALIQSGSRMIDQAALAADLKTFDLGFDALRQPIWLVEQPESDGRRWAALKAWMQAADNGWEVWIDWYQARLEGRQTIKELSGPANARIELARILQLKALDWKQGPAHANAKIRAIIERETERETERDQKPANEVIPEPKPASVGVIWRDGKAYLDTSPLSANVAAKLADEEKQALCEEIKELIDAIADDVNYDITPRTYLEKTLGMFPTAAPTSAELLKLARRETTLTEFAASVNAEWPDFQAAHFRSVVSGLSAYLNLFPLRRERRRIDISGVLEDVTSREARQDIERTSEVLKTETGNLIVDKSIPNAIDNVAQEIPNTEEPLEGAAREAAVDAYDGINNTAIVIAKNAGDSTNALAVLAEIGAETPEEAEAFLRGRSEQRLENFEKLGRAEGNVETGYQVSSGIARNRKELFGWIKRLFKNWGR